jgi:hypothetical protein
MGLWLSDTESDQRADGKPENDSESVRKHLTRVAVSKATDTVAKGKGLAHSECSGLQVAKVISIHTDSAKERREGANVDAPVVRAVRARVYRARLAFRASEEVVREDARVDHGKGSDDGRIRRSARVGVR